MSKKDKKKPDASTDTDSLTDTATDQSQANAATTSSNDQPSAESDAATQLAKEGNNKSSKTKNEDLDPNSIQVKVYSPYQTYYDAAAKSISAENDTGPFDILPRHHNFMTLVNPCEVIIRIDNAEDKKIRISRGVMHVRSNKVTLFLDV
jgi:hypothetical protein